MKPCEFCVESCSWCVKKVCRIVLGCDYMKWAGSFVARYTILHDFISNTAISSKLHWNYFTIIWGELKVSRLVLPCWLIFEKQAWSVNRASSSHVIIQSGLSMNQRMRILIINSNKKIKCECGKVRWKTKLLTTQAITPQQQAQIQIPNLNGWMTLLRIYSKLSVTLRQWWRSRIKISIFFLCFNFLNRRFGFPNSEWHIVSI